MRNRCVRRFSGFDDSPCQPFLAVCRLRARTANLRDLNQPESDLMKNSLIALAIVFAAAGAHAQVGTAVKEAGKATAETTKQGVENVKAATSSEPAKTVHKVKADVHKAKAKQAGTNAKAAAKEAVK